MTKRTWDERIVDLAILQRDNTVELETLRGVRAKLLKPYDDKIKALEAEITSERELLKLDAETHSNATGEKGYHSAIKVKFVDVPLYDPKEALAWAISKGMKEYLRTKVELDKRALNKAAASLEWVGVEVQKQVRVSIPDLLGEYIVYAERDAAED